VFRVSCLGFRVSGFGFRVSGFSSWFWVSGLGVRVSGFRFGEDDPRLLEEFGDSCKVSEVALHHDQNPVRTLHLIEFRNLSESVATLR